MKSTRGRGRQRINPREFATTGPRTRETAANYLLHRGLRQDGGGDQRGVSEMSWREGTPVRRVVHPECAFAGEYVEVFVAGRMVVRRGSPVDAKNACTGCLLVGQVGVHQQRFCRLREGFRDLVQIEATEIRALVLLIHSDSPNR